MADNVPITAGSGTPIAADDISSVWYQRVKITDGTADSTTPIYAGEGVKANALRVALPTDAADVKVTLDSETVELKASTATIGSVKTAESGRTMLHAKVALSASQTGATVLDPTAGKKFVLKKLIVSCKTAGDVYFYDDTDDSSHAIGPALTLAIGGGWSETWDNCDPYRSETVDHVLKYTSGSGLTGSAYIDYFEE